MADDAFLLLPLDRIGFHPQVRRTVDPDVVAAMARSIREVGVQLPVLVRRDGSDGGDGGGTGEGDGDRYVVIDGETRVRAARAAGLTVIPAVVLGDALDEGGVVHRQLVANVHRADLRPLERAEGLRRLIDATGWTAAEAADRLGLSPASVSRSLALLSLPVAIRDHLDAGTITASAAYELARVDDPAEQADLAGQAAAAAGGLTRDALRGRRRAGGRPVAAAANPKGNTARVRVALDGNRSLTLAGPCDGLEGLVGALQEVLGKARRAVAQGISLKTFAKVQRDQAGGAAGGQSPG